MSIDTGFKRFERLMADFAKIQLDPVLEELKANKPVTPQVDTNFEAIFYGFTDISATLNALKLSEVLIGIAPPRSRKIGKDEYLKFIVGTYLQEVYILEQRLSAYGTKISRIYKKRNLIKETKDAVWPSLEGIIKTRGSHVHESRYSDKYLEIVSTLTFVNSIKNELAAELSQGYSVAQDIWKDRVSENNKATDTIVDDYFDILFNNICVGEKIIKMW